MSDTSDMQMGLIDVGLFWGFYHAAVGKSPPEPGVEAQKRFEGFVRNWALKYRRAILCDDSPILARREVFPGYKPDGGRRHPEEGKALLAGAVASLESFGLPVVRVEGFEADDVIATIAEEAAARGWWVRIHSEDKDLLACLSDRVRVFRRDRGKGGARDWTPDDCKAQFKVHPHQLAEWLALASDTADGIPGVRQIGADGAAQLLELYGNVDAALLDQDVAGLPAARCPERVRKALAAGLQDFRLSLELAKLRKVPAGFISKLIQLPQPSSPPATRATPPDVAVEVREEAQLDGTVVQTLQETKAGSPSLLDEIVNTTNQRAAAERWIGREFSNSLEPRNTRDAWWLAETLDQAMVPGRKGQPPQRLFSRVGNKFAIYAVILKGRELGLPAMLALSHIHMVEGKAEVSAALMVALVLRSGKARYVRCTGSDNAGAGWETWREGASAPVSLAFTDEDRRRAGLGGSPESPWTKYPRVMFEWRAVSQLLRREYSDVVAGLYVTGELTDAGLEDVEAAIRGASQ